MSLVWPSPLETPWIPLGPLHPHLVLEALAYAVGFALYRRARRRTGDVLSDERRWTVVAAAAVGAALGSKALALLQSPGELRAALASPTAFLASGKTIVGGLLGGWLAVEWVKRRLGERRRTGDPFALPLVTGLAIGRLGCLLTGPGDHTWGRPTALILGLETGDGIARHPAPLYEIVFLIALGAALVRRAPHLAPGGAFRLFLASYLAFRVAVDCLKPAPTWLGLSAIQWAAALGLVALLRGPVGLPARAAPGGTSRA